MLKLGYIIIKSIRNESEKSTSSFIGDFSPPSNSNNSSKQYTYNQPMQIQPANTPNAYGKEQIAGTAQTGILGTCVSSCAQGNHVLVVPVQDNTHNGIAEFRANGDKVASRVRQWPRRSKLPSIKRTENIEPQINSTANLQPIFFYFFLH